MNNTNQTSQSVRSGSAVWRTFRRSAGVLIKSVLLGGIIPALHAVPVISTQPQSQGVLINGSVTLSVTAASSTRGTLTYQWFQGTPSTGTAVTNATTASLTVSPVTRTASYYVVITDRTTGQPTTTATSSAAVLTVLPGLERYGSLMSLQSTPGNQRPGFPEWYQDTTGLALELMTPKSAAELAGGWDVILPTDTTFVGTDAAGTVINGEPFPTGWFLEHFYFFARSLIADSTGTINDLFILDLALESTFGNGFNVVAGDEVVFSRIRINARRGAPVAGDYLIQTPYSEHEIKGVRVGDKLRVVEDVGIAPPPAGFALSLHSRVGPFLTASASPGGAELPLVAGPAGTVHLADPVIFTNVTGSPFGGARNAFRVFIKAAGATSYPATPAYQSTLFNLFGRVRTAPIPSRTSVDRVTKTVNGTDLRLDVFASAESTLPVRVPPAAPGVKRIPVLSLNIPGSTTGAKATMVSNTPAGSPTTYYWYQHPMATAAAVNGVASVTVSDDLSSVFSAPVRDAVWSNGLATPSVLFTPNAVSTTAGTLAIKCYSSSGAITAAAPATVYTPGLTSLANVTYVGSSNTLSVPGLTAPPAELVVASPGGGSEIFQINVAKKP